MKTVMYFILILILILGGLLLTLTYKLGAKSKHIVETHIMEVDAIDWSKVEGFPPISN